MILNRRETIAGLASTFAASAVAAPARGRVRAPLRRGVNLSHWFAQSFEGYTDAHLDHFVSLGRLAELARRGFDHVRLPVDPVILLADGTPTTLRDSSIRRLKAIVDYMHSQNLAVVFDLHPQDDAKQRLLRPDGVELFIRNWRLLAANFAVTSGSLYLEVLNEPAPLAGAAWWSIQDRVVHAIREENPDAVIVANGGNWSNIEDLIANRPYAVPNILYTVHYYAPILFTQQASGWGWAVARRVSHLGWPLAPGEAEAAASQATNDQEASRFVHDAVTDGSFATSAMVASFERLKAWQRAHGDPSVYVGEFGVLSKAAPPGACLRWLRAAREGFEARGWGWCLWDLSPSFGMLRPTPSHTYEAWRDMAMNADVLCALGMAA